MHDEWLQPTLIPKVFAKELSTTEFPNEEPKQLMKDKHCSTGLKPLGLGSEWINTSTKPFLMAMQTHQSKWNKFKFILQVEVVNKFWNSNPVVECPIHDEK